MIFYNILSIYFFVMVIAVIYWAANIKAINGSKYSLVAFLLSIAISCYILGYTVELNSNTIPQILFWNKFEYFGIPFVSALWLTIGIIYTGHFTHHKILWLVAIFGIPILTFLLRMTNEYHNLYFVSLDFIECHGKLLFQKDPGPWMKVQSIHSMSMILMTLFLLIQDFIKNKGWQLRKIVLIILVSLIAAFGLMLGYVNPFGYVVDYMAVCLPLSCLLVIVSIYRYDFLEVKAFARSKTFEFNRDAILLVSEQNKIIDYNKTAKELFAKAHIHLSEGYIDTVFQNSPTLLEKMKVTEICSLKLKIDSKEHYYKIRTKGIDNNRVHGYIKTIHDVTEAHELNNSLKQQALIDELSGLYNRRAFTQSGEEFIVKAEENGASVYLLMMDLDYFKLVNDRYGHQVGDQVIAYVGQSLSEQFSKNAFIARLGGEEFGVLLWGMDDEEALKKSNLFLNQFATHEFMDKMDIFHVTVSIGIAKKMKKEQQLNDLMKMADKALYQSKDCGRNCVTCY